MKRYIFYMLAGMAFLLPSDTKAQDFNADIPASETVFDRSHFANPRYEYMVRAAMLNMSDAFRFGRFRTLYTDTRQYDPLGDDTIDNMQNLAFLVQTETDTAKRRKALDDYQNLVMEHMANIRVVAQALSFAKLDKTFGSQKFFSWLRKGLVNDILSIGDGKTLQTAYNVMTVTEETVLMGQLGLRIIDTQMANEGGIYYNMHEVEDIRNGQVRTIFVNTTRPMRFLNYKRLQANSHNILKIMRQ